MTDLALVNANVLTMDPRAAAGRRRGRRARPDRRPGEVPAGAARVIDLRGAAVLPGFHDAHDHMTGFGMSLGEVDLLGRGGTLDELYAASPAAPGDAAGGWVIGSGYDQNKLGGHPDRDALDRAAPGRRVWLRHTSGHMCVVNAWSWPTSAWTRPPPRSPAAGSPPTPAAVPPACSRSGPAAGGQPGLPVPAGRTDRRDRQGRRRST